MYLYVVDGNDMLNTLLNDRFKAETDLAKIKRKMGGLFDDYKNHLKSYDSTILCDEFYQLKQIRKEWEVAGTIRNEAAEAARIMIFIYIYIYIHILSYYHSMQRSV